MQQIFKTKCIAKFRKYRSRKKFRFGGVKMAKNPWEFCFETKVNPFHCLPPLSLIFSAKVAIMIAARAAFLSEYIYN